MRNKATIALFIVTFIWGWTFVWLKQALEASKMYSTTDGTTAVSLLFVCIRFGLAACFLPLFIKEARIKIKDYAVWKDGFILALFMLGGFVFQMIGFVNALVNRRIIWSLLQFNPPFGNRRWTPCLILDGLIVFMNAAEH